LARFRSTAFWARTRLV